MLGLKLMHVSKQDPRYQAVTRQATDLHMQGIFHAKALKAVLI